jgi:hypothetical protein
MGRLGYYCAVRAVVRTSPDVWEERLAAEFGVLLVVQNIVSSLFNSHLFDFAEGWLYIPGVSAAGGIQSKGLPPREVR